MTLCVDVRLRRPLWTYYTVVVETVMPHADLVSWRATERNARLVLEKREQALAQLALARVCIS